MRRDRETLARTVSEAFDRKWQDPDLHTADTWLFTADAVLASDWLAEHDEAVRADERERVAVAIEALRPEYEKSPWRMGMDEAASIARTTGGDS